MNHREDTDASGAVWPVMVPPIPEVSTTGEPQLSGGLVGDKHPVRVTRTEAPRPCLHAALLGASARRGSRAQRAGPWEGWPLPECPC